MANHIYKYLNGYYVRKEINNKLYALPVVHDLEEAKKNHDECKNTGWSLEYYEQKKKEKPRGDYYTGEKYITKINNKYSVKKTINGKTYSTPVFNTIEEAKEIRAKWKAHGWGLEYYNKIKKECGYTYFNRNTLPHYYIKHNGKYDVKKRLNGKTVHFGRYDTEEEAKERVEFLKKHNWDEQYIQKRIYPTTYIYKTLSNNYTVTKYLNGKKETFGTFKDLQDAINERNHCIECDWDWELICQ